MPILAVAFGIYIFGVSIVLYLRPTLMFGSGGDWKEFGIGRGDQRTVVPFWLFAIFWAFISYGVALVIMSNFANLASPESQMAVPMTMQAPTPSMTFQAPPIQAPPIQPANFIKPVSSSIGVPNSSPGYYVLQNTNNTGLPQYVYYGTEPPRFN